MKFKKNDYIKIIKSKDPTVAHYIGKKGIISRIYDDGEPNPIRIYLNTSGHTFYVEEDEIKKIAKQTTLK